MILSAKRQALFPLARLSSASTPSPLLSSLLVTVKPTAVTGLHLTNHQQPASTEHAEEAMYS